MLILVLLSVRLAGGNLLFLTKKSIITLTDIFYPFPLKGEPGPELPNIDGADGDAVSDIP
jgi:hypothetical protein